ncbi:MAG: F0F1 ATP synthase subunit delta [bacterium]|nr:F0F1 ATP synthase subunit delta [bacterium]
MYSSRQIAKSLKVMEADQGAEKTASKFFAFVGRYNLWNVVPSVLAHLEGSADKSDEFETLKVRAPYALTEDAERKIRKVAGADKDTVLEFKTDKSLLGGFVANYKGFEHEGSLGRIVQGLARSIRE